MNYIIVTESLFKNTIEYRTFYQHKNALDFCKSLETRPFHYNGAQESSKYFSVVFLSLDAHSSIKSSYYISRQSTVENNKIINPIRIDFSDLDDLIMFKLTWS